MTCPTCHHILTTVNIVDRTTNASTEVTKYKCYSCKTEITVSVEVTVKSPLSPEELEKVTNKPN